jgi:hypothetical protein
VPPIGILQAYGLARIEAIRISLQVSWSADGKPGGGFWQSTGPAPVKGHWRGRIRGSAVTTCHNKSLYALTLHLRCPALRQTRSCRATADVALAIPCV